MLYLPLSRIRVPGLDNLVVRSRLKKQSQFGHRSEKSIRHGIRYKNYENCAIDMRALCTVGDQSETVYITCLQGTLDGDKKKWIYEKEPAARKANGEARLIHTDCPIAVKIELFCQPRLPHSRVFLSEPTVLDFP